MKVIVCGSRDWRWTHPIFCRLRLLPKDTTIIHGNCRGADKMAASIAASMGFDVVPCDADWDKYGKRAGPIRNRKMLAMQPDLVICFHEDIDRSRGSKDMVNIAEGKCPIEIIKE